MPQLPVYTFKATISRGGPKEELEVIWQETIAVGAANKGDAFAKAAEMAVGPLPETTAVKLRLIRIDH